MGSLPWELNPITTTSLPRRTNAPYPDLQGVETGRGGGVLPTCAEDPRILSKCQPPLLHPHPSPRRPPGIGIAPPGPRERTAGGGASASLALWIHACNEDGTERSSLSYFVNVDL